MPGHDGGRASGFPTALVNSTRRLIFASGLAALGVAITQAAAQPLQCRDPQKPSQVAELLFGRSIAGRPRVSEREWERFVDREISPRFPDGLTVFDGTGRWRDPGSRKILRESGKIVQIVLPGAADDLDRLSEIVDAYKRRFHQQSVGVIVRPACVSF